MQPEPIENLTRIITPFNPSEPINASQHGIRSEEVHSADASSAPNSIQALSARDARLQEELRRLSLADTHNKRSKPSFQRISEHENALSQSPPRKQNEGPGFKIIKKKSDRIDGPQLDAFPNGMRHVLEDFVAWD